MDKRRARELVAAERSRIEAALHDVTGEVADEGDLDRQQTGESDSGSELAADMVDMALVADLRSQLEAVVRAEQRIAAGTFGISIQSGATIPDERLEAEPLAEYTVGELQR